MNAAAKGVNQTPTLGEGVTSANTPDVFHVFVEPDLQMADTFGLEVRALCGWWTLPCDDEGGPLEGNAYRRQVRLCRNCTRTKAYRR